MRLLSQFTSCCVEETVASRTQDAHSHCATNLSPLPSCGNSAWTSKAHLTDRLEWWLNPTAPQTVGDFIHFISFIQAQTDTHLISSCSTVHVLERALVCLHLHVPTSWRLHGAQEKSFQNIFLAFFIFYFYFKKWLSRHLLFPHFRGQIWKIWCLQTKITAFSNCYMLHSSPQSVPWRYILTIL